MYLVISITITKLMAFITFLHAYYANYLLGV